MSTMFFDSWQSLVERAAENLARNKRENLKSKSRKTCINLSYALKRKPCIALGIVIVAGSKTGEIGPSCSPRGDVILSDSRSVKDHVELTRKLNCLCCVKSKVKAHVRNTKLRKLVKLLNAKL